MDNLPFFSYEFFAKITAIILGYMIGSIPFGLLLTRICGFNDIRSIGSGNIGATNVLRTGNKKLAFITLLFDSIKATATIIVVSMLFNDKVGALAGLATFLGHIFPVYLKFKGGKGVSTYIGVLIALKPEMVIFFAIIWILFALITRYSSIASLFATLIDHTSRNQCTYNIYIHDNNSCLETYRKYQTFDFWIRNRNYF